MKELNQIIATLKDDIITSGEDGFAAIAHTNGVDLELVASWGEGWEHVSVVAGKRKRQRMPTWAEMCFIKDLFWRPDECVIQYHPAEVEYVNCHSNCLHLWRPTDVEFPIPPKVFV